MKDPLGNRERWFCDNGQNKGFVDAAILTQYTGAEADKEAVIEDKDTSKPVAVVAPYDEVTEDEYKKPTRKAPPVPVKMTAATGVTGVRTPGIKTRSDQMSVHSYEEISAELAMCADQQLAMCSDQVSRDLSPVYEEIPGGSR